MSNRLGVPTAQRGGYLYRRRAVGAHGADDVVIGAGEGAAGAVVEDGDAHGADSSGAGGLLLGVTDVILLIVVYTPSDGRPVQRIRRPLRY